MILPIVPGESNNVVRKVKYILSDIYGYKFENLDDKFTENDVAVIHDFKHYNKLYPKDSYKKNGFIDQTLLDYIGIKPYIDDDIDEDIDKEEQEYDNSNQYLNIFVIIIVSIISFVIWHFIFKLW